jgi:hypothetical protein
VEIFIILVMIGAGVALAAAQSNRRKLSEAWQEAASQLRIRHNAGDLFTKPELYGRVRDCRVKITIRSKHQGNHSKRYTCYEVTYPRALPFALSLKEQTAFSGIKKFLGGQDIEVGDPTFDAFVVVRSHDSTQVREFLNPTRRLYVRRILSMHPGAEITDSQVKWDCKGAEGNCTSLANNVKRLVDFAINMTANAEDYAGKTIGDSETEAGPKRLSDDIEAVFTVEDHSQPKAYVVDSIAEPPGLVSIEAEERKFEPDNTAAFDQMQQDIEDLLETDTETPATINVPQEDQIELPSTRSLDVKDVCNDLFGSRKISYEINELFGQKYRGEAVRWTGKLSRVDAYPFDLVFGNDPGTRAEFEIAGLEGESVDSQTVMAMVQLPADRHETLSNRVGETIAFTGILVKCDSFMRILFVRDGSTEEAG